MVRAQRSSLACALLRKKRAAERDEEDLSHKDSSSGDSHLRRHAVNYSRQMAQIPLSIKKRMHFSWGSLSKSSEAVPALCDGKKKSETM